MIESMPPAGFVSENGVTPARLAISCSPICQCIASTARHGMAISSATLAHISARNLDVRENESVNGFILSEREWQNGQDRGTRW